MDDKQKEFLESICLKTIDTMFNEKNINVLPIIKQSYEKELFFAEFYEIMFLKMITQFGGESLLPIVINYPDFGLDSYKACTIFNDAIKHMDLRQYFTHHNSAYMVTKLNEHNLFIDSHNIDRIKNNIDYTKRDEIIENNDKFKSYFTLNNKLPAKGISSKPGKI